MKSPFPQTHIPLVAPVYAGQSTPDNNMYWPIESFRTVRIPVGISNSTRLAATRVIGDSLLNANIVDGDLLIFEFNRSAKPGDLVIASTPFGQTVKYFWPSDDGIVILKCANEDYCDQVWSYSDVTIQGVVIRVERDLK